MLFNSLLVLHVAGGATALLSGPVPMMARKGGPLHRRAGRVYAAAMMLTAVSAFALAIATASELLLVIAVSTFFLVFSGVRAIGFRRGGRPGRTDDIVCSLALAFSGWLLWRGIGDGQVTSLFFGLGGIALAGRQLWRLHGLATDWLEVHLTAMGGAYIATVTAFLVVNITFLPLAVVFIAPTLLGSPLIAWAVVRHQRNSFSLRAAFPSA